MRRLFEHPVTFPMLTTALFVLAFFAGVMAVPEPGKTPPELIGVEVSFIAKALLSVAFLALAGWFMHAFTQADAQAIDDKRFADQRASMFRFAYMFSLFSFALLVLPFTAMLRAHESPPDAGPIRLLRACVQPLPSARPASGALAGPIDLCPDPPPTGTVSYPWLVAVGGVVARECGKDDPHCSRPVQPQAGSTPRAHVPLYSVMGGFVVPFYVVVFSFVGGVVNLTRRVPEYQKRSSCHFEGTANESVVTLLEAREFVVFQIMQLMTAPFVAMVAYYAMEPKSIASAVGLAFVSGFATESVLLLIRGMVNGLKPETTTKTAAASGPAATAKLHVVVKRAGANVEKARVEVRRQRDGTPALKVSETNAAGAVEFAGLAPGTVWVVVAASGTAGVPGQENPPQEVSLVAGETRSLELTLK